MRKVLLSKRASNKLEKLLKYLELEWPHKVKTNYINKLDKTLEHISQYPESAQKSDLVKGLHRVVVTKQTTVYYKFDSKSIMVVTIFDTRMNPKRLKKETK